MKKPLITLLILLLSSCSTFRVSTLYYDPIYGPDGTEIVTDVIDNEFQLARKLQTDFTFRYNFAQYAMNQPYSWYFNNRTLNRYSMWNPNIRFDMYNNSHNFWMNWAFDYPYSNFGYNWRDPFGFNNYYSGWQNRYAFGWNSWNYRPYYDQFRVYNNNRRDRNISYNRGRRGMSSETYNRNTSVITNSTKGRRGTILNPQSATVGSTVNIDNVVETIRRENKGRTIRVYTNPNSIPDVIIRGNNSRSSNIRINRRPNINSINNNPIRNNYRSSNNSIRSTPNVRSNSSSTRSSNSSTRSSSSSSRGGRGINNN